MRYFRRFYKGIASVLCTSALLFTLATGCTSNNDDTVKNKTQFKEPFKITMMNILYNPEPPKLDNPILKSIESYTNTQLDITWIPNTYYEDKLIISIASGETPMAVLVSNNRSSSIINAQKSNVFWELGPYYSKFKNLKEANTAVLNNISVDGKIYGIYRSRELGRNGIIYRRDWLERLGLKEPKTIEDFYQILKAFTTQDPDRNGENDTYGLISWKGSDTSAPASWGEVLSWFGGPTGWEEDKNGRLIPSYMTSAYMDALNFYRKLYNEKLMNQDFAVMDVVKARDLFEKGKAGVLLSAIDDAIARTANMEKTDPTAKVDVLGSVAGPKGLRTPATSGYNGLFMLPKASVKSEVEVERIVDFFDKLCDQKMQDLLTWGVEGREYVLENGKPKVINAKLEIDELGPYKQFQLGIIDNVTRGEASLIKQRCDTVMQSNRKFAISNPCEPFISPTYTQKGSQLDTMIENARVKYILGEIDATGFKNTVELWLKSGGNEIINEMNTEYARLKQQR